MIEIATGAATGTIVVVDTDASSLGDYHLLL